MKRMKQPVISLAVSILLALAFACKKLSPIWPYEYNDPRIELNQTYETDHFIFHYSMGDYIESERAEAYHRWAVAFLGVTCPKKIDYFKFKDREQLYQVMGSLATGYVIFSNYEVWTYVPWLNHECMHLYSMLYGQPSTLFLEGLAVAYQIDPYSGDYEAREQSGERVHDVVRRYLAEGKLYPLETLITAQGWYQSDFTTTYSQAGSFMRYLADFHGIEKVKDIYRTIRSDDSAEAVKTKFLGIYGFSLEQAEVSWLGYLK